MSPLSVRKGETKPNASQVSKAIFANQRKFFSRDLFRDFARVQRPINWPWNAGLDTKLSLNEVESYPASPICRATTSAISDAHLRKRYLLLLDLSAIYIFLPVLNSLPRSNFSRTKISIFRKLLYLYLDVDNINWALRSCGEIHCSDTTMEMKFNIECFSERRTMYVEIKL